MRLPEHGSANAALGIMTAGPILAALLVAFLLPAGALAKEFRPGDVRVCNATRCVAIDSPSALTALSSFYYNPSQHPLRVSAPSSGVPFFRLEFSDGYISGIVASPGLGHFLSYGVNLEQFGNGAWYRVPPPLAAALRRLTSGVPPLRLTPGAIHPNDNFVEPPVTKSPSNHEWLPWVIGLAALSVGVALALLAVRRRGPREAQVPIAPQ